MNHITLMTAGPTQVRENVRLARSTVTTNPDEDISFCEYYKQICDKLADFFHTKNTFYLLSGEGILGLEAACASLTEVGDRVLVIDNGIFGKGFADFVKIYGGEPILYTVDDKEPVNVNQLEEYLKKDNNFKYATVVHCDTPSGMLNDVEAICPVLKQYGILTVVDSVSASFGVPLDVGKAQIDILCGGSQKALSAPIGLTFLGVSDKAIEVMQNRKTPIASFYANILSYVGYYEKKWFPYTMPISDIYGFGTALENILKDKELFLRHQTIAQATRKAVEAAGLKQYIKNGYSDTVTAIVLPEGISAKILLDIMTKRFHIMISGYFGELAGKVIRIGHMGENANIADVAQTLAALGDILTDMGVTLKCDMRKIFLEETKTKVIVEFVKE